MYYLGIDLGGTNIAIGIVDEDYKIVKKGTQEVIATIVEYGEADGDARGTINVADYNKMKGFLLKQNNDLLLNVY